MANTDKPNGFRPVSHLSGAPYNGAFTKMYCAANLFKGDIVEQTTADGIASGDGIYQSVIRMADGATSIPIGVVVGWELNPTALTNLYHVGSGTYAVFVATDPTIIFECQGDGAGTILGATEVGMNTDVVLAGGDIATGLSNMEVDEDTTAAIVTAATPLRIMGIADVPGNEAGVANQKIRVMLNMHSYNNDAGTAGNA